MVKNKIAIDRREVFLTRSFYSFFFIFRATKTHAVVERCPMFKFSYDNGVTKKPRKVGKRSNSNKYIDIRGWAC